MSSLLRPRFFPFSILVTHSQSNRTNRDKERIQFHCAPSVRHFRRFSSVKMTQRRGLDLLPLAQSTITFLTLTQRISAITFSTFLLTHLSAPFLAAIAPPGNAEKQASGFMVLGRVYYQEKLEKVVVWGAVAVHLSSGIAGRALKSFERRERRSRRKEEARRGAMVEGKDVQLEDFTINPVLTPRHDEGKEEDDTTEFIESYVVKDDTLPKIQIESPPTRISHFGQVSLQHLTGYLLIPIALHHSYLHRILPASEHHRSLSPTLLSYSFVSYSLSSSYALISAVGYAAVLSLGSYHALSGLRRILYPMAPRGMGRRTIEGGRGGWMITYGVTVFSVLVGVVRLAGEGGTPRWLGRRYHDVLKEGFTFRTASLSQA